MGSDENGPRIDGHGIGIGISHTMSSVLEGVAMSLKGSSAHGAEEGLVVIVLMRERGIAL